jgi:phospholipase C
LGKHRHFRDVDEGGGYYDSGYVQPLDLFGDGTRIPLIVVSPYTSAGHISHSYTDHVSILKLIERKWNLGTISKRSRDNLPNPKRQKATPTFHPTAPLSATYSTSSTSAKKVQDND